MKKIAFFSLVMIGAMFIFTSAIPLLYSYPYSVGPNSGPSNTLELVQMIAYNSWELFLTIGVVLLIASVLGLKGKILSH